MGGFQNKKKPSNSFEIIQTHQTHTHLLTLRKADTGELEV